MAPPAGEDVPADLCSVGSFLSNYHFFLRDAKLGQIVLIGILQPPVLVWQMFGLDLGSTVTLELPPNLSTAGLDCRESLQSICK